MYQITIIKGYDKDGNEVRGRRSYLIRKNDVFMHEISEIEMEFLKEYINKALNFV